MTDNEVTEKRDATERRVYNLPADLLERLRAYQLGQGIASEAEAARRLLDSALQMRDTVDILIAKLKSRFAYERDLRALNKEVLAAHPLIAKIELDDTSVTFTMRSGDMGKITISGQIYKGEENQYMTEIIERIKQQPRITRSQSTEAPSWTTEKSGGDLDDDVPF